MMVRARPAPELKLTHGLLCIYSLTHSHSMTLDFPGIGMDSHRSRGESERGKEVSLDKPSRSASGFAGAASKAWSYITNEAALADAEAPPPSIPRPSLDIILNVQLQGLLLQQFD